VLTRRSFSEVGKSWTHSEFNVFVGDPIDPTDKKRLLFAARYLKKCPISNQRLTLLKSNGVTINEYSSLKDGIKNIRSFQPLEFLAELQQHNLSAEALQREGGSPMPGSRPAGSSEFTPPVLAVRKLPSMTRQPYSHYLSLSPDPPPHGLVV
jgi:Putative transposase